MITLRMNKETATRVHDALVGTPEYINSRIVISEMKDGSGRFELILGDENNNDLVATFVL